MHAENQDALLRLPQVLELFPVSQPLWYLGIRKGIYPKPVKLGVRAVAWRRSDIEKLISDVSNKSG